MPPISTQSKPTARALFGPEAKAAPKAGSAAGDTLKDEAVSHLQNRQWKDAIRVSLAAQTLRPHDLDIHAIVAVSAAYSKKKDLCRRAVRALRTVAGDPDQGDLDRANALIAIASVRIAQERFSDADTEARKALAFDSGHRGAWWQLTAGFAGLGWFDEAGECLPLAREGAPTPEASTTDSVSNSSAESESEPATEAASKPVVKLVPRSRSKATGPGTNKEPLDGMVSFSEWQVGRAVNSWAMSRTPALVVAVVGFMFFGMLGLALAASTPFIAREIRVMRLDEQWREMAERAWRTEHSLRIKHALITLLMIALWVASLAITNAG